MTHKNKWPACPSSCTGNSQKRGSRGSKTQRKWPYARTGGKSLPATSMAPKHAYARIRYQKAMILHCGAASGGPNPQWAAASGRRPLWILNVISLLFGSVCERTRALAPCLLPVTTYRKFWRTGTFFEFCGLFSTPPLPVTTYRLISMKDYERLVMMRNLSRVCHSTGASDFNAYGSCRRPIKF